ncbi:MAG TPA: DNA repair protein RadA [Bacteroidetes bacterium]|nr:DNA repair protein RadA [Bacteroidota bacterium]
MNKIKSVFYCKECGGEHAKWLGKCSFCNTWNTIIEKKIKQNPVRSSIAPDLLQTNTPLKLDEIADKETERLIPDDEEFKRVLGGGIVSGSMVLIGGEPGIGKSTLMLQVALSLKAKTLYVSGEESLAQIKMRAKRINHESDQCYFLDSNDIRHIAEQLKLIDANILIIDSIQTLISDAVEGIQGSITQIRQCATELQHLAKKENISIFIIGHINKEGHLAGPKILEHMVDVVLQFEGDDRNQYRMLRTLKNRYGSTAELGIYEMTHLGLEEVSNASQAFIEQREENYSGIAVGVGMEGLRPIMIETQALVSPAVYGNPQRTTNGIDQRRVHMLLAVLEKRCGLKLGTKDVFLNIAGGIKLKDTALDLGMICCIISSYLDQSINPKCCFASEVGLSGEIRPISHIELRIKEAAKLGFKKIFISSSQKMNFQTPKGISIEHCNKIQDVVPKVFKV